MLPIILGYGIYGVWYFFTQGEELLATGLYLPLLVILNSPRIYMIKIFLRQAKYASITICNLILYGVFVSGVATALSLDYIVDVYSLLDFFSLGTFLSSLYCLAAGWKYARPKETTNILFYREYSLPVTAQSLLNTSVRQLDIVLLSVFMGSSSVGIYSLSKQVFKFFEEAGMAAASLFNPTFVRQIANKQFKNLKPLLEKVYAYMAWLFVISLVVVWTGLLEWVMIGFFPDKDIESAMNLLSIMSLSGLFLPLFVLSFTFNALGEEKSLLKYNVISSIAAFIVFLIFGNAENLYLYSLGLVTYYSLIAIFTYNFIKKRFDFRLVSITRVFRDISGMRGN